MADYLVSIYEARIGDLVNIKAQKLWGKILKKTRFQKIDIILENGEIIENLGAKETYIFREVEDGSEIDCFECNGEGSNEIGPECSLPASYCCGGCYRIEKCDKCGGSGKIIIE